jgi:hypothetical protein
LLKNIINCEKNKVMRGCLGVFFSKKVRKYGKFGDEQALLGIKIFNFCNIKSRAIFL